MRVKLLKKLRKDAAEEVKFHCGKYAFLVYSFEGKEEHSFDGRIDSDENKAKIKAAIEQQRRNVIMHFVRGFRCKNLMKEL